MDALSLYEDAANGDIFDVDRFNQSMSDIEDAINKFSQSETDGDSGADHIAVTPIPALGANVKRLQPLLEAMYTAMTNIVLGNIPDGSIGESKLDFNAVTQTELEGLAGNGRTTETVKGAYDLSSANMPVSSIIYVSRKTPPTGFLKANGAAVSRTTYANLFNAICPAQTFTVTIASPAVFSATAHGLSEGDPIRFSTTGALPTGLSTSTTYYVISSGLTTDAFQVSASVGGAAVNTTGTQSGTHTLRLFSHGVGDGSTTFNLPDMRGVAPRGWDDSRGYDSGRVFGSYQADDNKTHNHTASSSTTGAHTHTVPFSDSSYAIYTASQGNPSQVQDQYTTTSSSSGDHSHTITVDSTGSTEAKVKNVALLACIKY